MKRPSTGDLATIGCAVIGGVAGYIGFGLLLQNGYYALILPGGVLGLVAGIPRSRSMWVPLVCAVLALIAGLLAEHRFAPFVVDGSFSYFVRHAGQLHPFTLVLIAIGGAIGFWVPFRRRIHSA